MEKTHNSVFSKLMSFLFIAIGVFLGIYAFFVQGTTWNVGGTLSWDNTTGYLNSDFWDANPTDDDIIRALYGSGDEGSVYTENWTGYTSGSCLNNPMNVVYTGVIPATIDPYTIYVIASGNYDIGDSLEMTGCSALISSGTAILTKTGSFHAIYASGVDNFIVDNIKINGNDNSSYGIYLSISSNNTINNIHSYRQRGQIILNTSSNNNTISNSLIYTGNSQITTAITITNSSNNIINNNTMYQNANGVSLSNSSGNIIKNNTIYQNTESLGGYGIILSNSNNNNINNNLSYRNRYGISLSNSSGNIISSSIFSGNIGYGILLSGSINNIGTNIESYNNTSHNLSLNNSHTNTFTDIVANSSQTAMGVYIANSTGNVLSGVQAYGNILDGIYITGGENNLFQNIEIYNNTGGFMLYNTSGAILDTIYTHDMLGTGNSISIENTRHTTIKNSNIFNTGNQNSIFISGGYSNTISGTMLSGAGIGILLKHTYNNIIRNSSSYNNNYRSLYLFETTGHTIQNFSGYGIGNSMYEENSHGLFLSTLYDIPTQNNNYILLESTANASITGTVAIGGIYSTPFDELSLASGNNTIRLVGTTGLTVSGSTWDGILYSPTQITAGTKLAQIGETGTNTIVNFLDTIEVVSGTSYLTMNGGTGTIAYEVPGGTSGAYMQILKSTEGNTWTINTPISGCILNQDLLCTFDVVGTIKLFAFGIPNGLFTGTSFLGDTIVSGGYYATGVTITYQNPNLSGATLNGNPYISGTSITGDNTYTFIMEDIFGNTTGMIFTIDTTIPLFTGETFTSLPVISGGFYNTGITITFSDDNLSGATLNGNVYTSGDIISTDDIYIFFVEDLAENTTGMTFTIDTTNPIVTGNYPTSGLNITGTNSITFTWTGTDTNMSGYYFSLTGTEIHTGYLTGTSISHLLPNGNYIWEVIAMDKAGNTGSSQALPFSITTPLSGTASITGAHIIQAGPSYYTRSDATFALRANQPCTYTLTGNHITTLTGNYVTGIIVSRPLSGNDGSKAIYITFSTGSEIPVTITRSIILDTVANPPTLINPASGLSVSGTISLGWNPPTIETPSISGYKYYLSNTNTFATILKSGFVAHPTTGVNITDITTTGTLYRYVSTVDTLGNEGHSTGQSFIYTSIVTVDTTPHPFSFTNITNALLDRVYISNTITITGMTSGVPVLASVNRGALYISGNFVGTTGYIQNGRPIKIELISSNQYSTEVNSTLTIGGVSSTFRVTTRSSTYYDDYNDIDTSLSNTTKLQIIAIFEALRDLYAGNKAEEFFNTLLVMLQSKINATTNNNTRDALQYLYDLVYYHGGQGGGGDTIDNTRRIVNGYYTAPNGKKYKIVYDTSKQRFSSPDFVTPKYFPTLDTLKYIIDINNPLGSKYATSKTILARWRNAAIDGTRQTSPYTAPNRKVFYFFKTINNRYSSYTFTSERRFTSLNDVKEFIYNTNR